MTFDEFTGILMHEFGGPTRSESACEMVIRLLREQRDTLLAVADAGETGEGHVWDADWPMDVVILEDRLDYLCAIADQQSTDHNAHVIATAEHLEALRRDVTQLEAFAAGSIEPTAALRRDVDTLEALVSDRILVVTPLPDAMAALSDRIKRLESRERPEPGGVSDAMVEAFWRVYSPGSEWSMDSMTATASCVRRGIKAALAAWEGKGDEHTHRP